VALEGAIRHTGGGDRLTTQAAEEEKAILREYLQPQERRVPQWAPRLAPDEESALPKHSFYHSHPEKVNRENRVEEAPMHGKKLLFDRQRRIDEMAGANFGDSRSIEEEELARIDELAEMENEWEEWKKVDENVRRQESGGGGMDGDEYYEVPISG